MEKGLGRCNESKLRREHSQFLKWGHPDIRTSVLVVLDLVPVSVASMTLSYVPLYFAQLNLRMLLAFI